MEHRRHCLPDRVACCFGAGFLSEFCGIGHTSVACIQRVVCLARHRLFHELSARFGARLHISLGRRHGGCGRRGGKHCRNACCSWIAPYGGGVRMLDRERLLKRCAYVCLGRSSCSTHGLRFLSHLRVRYSWCELDRPCLHECGRGRDGGFLCRARRADRRMLGHERSPGWRTCRADRLSPATDVRLREGFHRHRGPFGGARHCRRFNGG